MAEIRILDEKLKYILKNGDKSLEKFVEVIETNANKTLVDLTSVTLDKNTWKLELFALTVVRKLFELRVELQEKVNNVGAVGRNDFERIVHFERFLVYVNKCCKEYLERGRQKMLTTGLVTTMPPQFAALLVMEDILFKPFSSGF